MDLSKISLLELRMTLKNVIATDPFKARNDCVCLLMLTNFSRVGEVANMTVTEVKEVKEVAPGYFSVEVIQKLLHFSPFLCLSLLNNILSFVSFCVLLGNVLHSV